MIKNSYLKLLITLIAFGTLVTQRVLSTVLFSSKYRFFDFFHTAGKFVVIAAEGADVAFKKKVDVTAKRGKHCLKFFFGNHLFAKGRDLFANCCDFFANGRDLGVRGCFCKPVSHHASESVNCHTLAIFAPPLLHNVSISWPLIKNLEP